MERYEYEKIEVDEKSGLLPQQVRNDQVRHQNWGKPEARKTNFGLGVVVATVLFLWWSVYAIPSLLSIGDDGWDDETELSFDEVRTSQPDYIFQRVWLIVLDHSKRKVGMASMLPRYRNL
jgi:hypothetical protein